MLIEYEMRLEIKHHQQENRLASSNSIDEKQDMAAKIKKNLCRAYVLLAVRSIYFRLVLLLSTLILLFYFRLTILTLFYMIRTYCLWHQYSSSVISHKDNFDSSMLSYPENQTSAGPNYSDLVPPIIHHIVIGSIDLNQRPTWLAARDACLKLHPNYEYRFWNETTATNLIQEEFPWFYQTWISYPYAIQRADSLRYLVLYQYGGIFLDMDLHCRRALGPLRRFQFVSPAAYPVGISNGFLMTSKAHPFFRKLVDELPLFDRNFLLPYATVMFSTGCMYISAQYARFHDRTHLRVLNYEQHRLSGRIHTPLFDHEGSSSWHAQDANFIKATRSSMKILLGYQDFFVILLLILFILLVSLSRHRRRLKLVKISDQV